MGYLLVYTRVPEAAQYHAALAYSVHFAYSSDGEHFEPFHQNYGILFAMAGVTAQNTIAGKALVHPRLVQLPDGSYLIQAQQTNAQGDPEPLFPQWTTRDFRTFHDLGASPEPADMPAAAASALGLSGIVPGNCLAIGEGLGQAALQYWSPLHNTQLHVNGRAAARNAEDVQGIGVTAVYSDGSTCQKRVKWDVSNVDFHQAGEYRISGTAQQLELPFPITRGHGDPVIFPWHGMVYYIATNDNNDDRGFIVRRAATVELLFSPEVEQSVILDVNETYVQTFWAPEFHTIGGELYLLFAVSGKQWGPQCHMMKLKPGGDILCAQDWEAPVRVCRMDGRPLAENGITLDMTYIPAAGCSYVVWSYREHIGTGLDSGSMLYIAAINPGMPARLSSEPVLLSRPLYGWENIDGTINNEGPYAFLHQGRVYLTYSGGSANRYSYAVGLLTADEKTDLLKPGNWQKRPTPVLSYVSISGRYGTGHNSFFMHDGQLYIAYHALYNLTEGPRCAALHRIHFDCDDEPRFDLSPQRDLNPALRKVFTTIRVL